MTSLVSMPVDVIRMRSKKNLEGDDERWVVERLDVISVTFPPLTDVPIRRIRKDGEEHWALTSLVDSYDDGKQAERYLCEAPLNHGVDVGDLIVRPIRDESVDYFTILLLKVSELLGSFGGMELIKTKFNCTIPTDTIPSDVLASVAKMIERRKAVGY
jgi:hypothetical protein